MIVRPWECLAPQWMERCTQEKPGHIPDGRARRANVHFCGPTEPHIVCDHPGCTETVPISWGQQLSASARRGWMIKKNGEAWCFDHLPDWVVPWRDKNKPGWRARLKKELREKLPKQTEGEGT